MKQFFSFDRFTVLFATICLLAIAACNKKFDEPPLNADPDIAVTMTIAELKAKYQSANNFQTINDDKVISGIVTADDRSGNFYKQIIIQDETGGIPILMDQNSLYATYPVGRRVFVKLKGLMLGDYGGTIQLGLDSTRSGNFLNLGRIPSPMFETYLVAGSFGNSITPKIVKPSDFTGAINDPLLSSFIQINNAEFRDADLVKTYANAASPTTESARNFTIKPCNDTKSIVLRNSSYATFAGVTVAQGNGPLVGVASIFNGTVQLTIRDTSDVQFKGTRCNGQTPVGSTKTIAEVLAYATGDSTIPAGTWIEGVVVSNTKNEAAGNYRLQDATAGIQIRFANGSYPVNGAVGDKLQVYVGGYKISQFNGGLQVNGADVSISTGTGTVAPRVATIAQITANMRAWESTVVTINTVTVTGSGSNYTIADATGSLPTFVRAASGITMPTAATGITGYVTVYQPAGGTAGPQLTLRSQDDIVGGTTTPPSSGGGFNLVTSPVLFDFNNLATGLPTGVKVVNAARADTIGQNATLTTTPTPWNQTSAAFKNFASGTGLASNTAVADQASAANRALGVRQTGGAGWDGGSNGGPAFVFVINNTTGKSNIKLDFILQQLDGVTAAGRTTKWVVEYGIGEDPRTFTAVTTTPTPLTTILGTFNAGTAVHVDFPAALNNLSSKVWVRIAALDATEGGGSRSSTAIDDVKFSW